MNEQDIRKQFMDNYLLEELFESKRGRYSIYLYAGWQLIAMCNDNLLIENVGGQFWFLISEADAFTLIKHSADGSDRRLFRSAVDEVSAIYTFQQSILNEAFIIKAEVERGEREMIVSKEGLRTLKEGYIARKQKMMNKYGTSPHFSEIKFKTCMIASIFTCYGGPFWISGRILPTLLCIAFTFFSVITMNPIAMMILGGSFYVGPIWVGCGKFKDKKGLYVMSERQKQNVMYSFRLLEKYKKEL